ncbi:methyl-CpG-binding protein 2-like isoform X1 [Lethenteron reissneri]|uniref:methyl-CpG-binding protein 2-like isoform X1 n=2 Tax=Lethenteron reissneri TaxID=7753 RepID=UPI002AB7D72B|nr:methyl-CpG-binding protein 2-like isoform X1 [Lethenteron reissneri]
MAAVAAASARETKLSEKMVTSDHENVKTKRQEEGVKENAVSESELPAPMPPTPSTEGKCDASMEGKGDAARALALERRNHAQSRDTGGGMAGDGLVRGAGSEAPQEKQKRASRGPAPPMHDDPSLPAGWLRKLKQRKSGRSAGKYDVYIFSPEGKQFRSHAELRVYFGKVGEGILKPEDFDFTVGGRGRSDGRGNRYPRMPRSPKATGPTRGQGRGRGRGRGKVTGGLGRGRGLPGRPPSQPAIDPLAQGHTGVGSVPPPSAAVLAAGELMLAKRKRGRKPKLGAEAFPPPRPPPKKAKFELPVSEEKKTVEVANLSAGLPVIKEVPTVIKYTAPQSATVGSAAEVRPQIGEPEDRQPKVNFKFYKQRSKSNSVDKPKKREEPKPKIVFVSSNAPVRSEAPVRKPADGNKLKEQPSESAVAVPDSSSSPSQLDQGRSAETRSA